MTGKSAFAGRVRMSLSPQSERAFNGAESVPNAAMVREQLKRLLAHPLFTNSKRYPVLLAYTVEQTLGGSAGELKERTIGVEAFRREPDYDVNLDPVVRTTAAEVRKRLIQYYYNPDHAGELVIEMPVGSYVPSFREPPTPQTALDMASVLVGRTQPSGRELVSGDAEKALSGRVGRRWISIGIALLSGALGGFFIGHAKFPKPQSNLERFWAPITATSSRITYCVGEKKDSLDREHGTELNPPGDLNLSDVTTLARSIGPLVLGKSNFRVVSALDTEFTQLREGPVVLIGAYNNQWTLRITQGLPLGFDNEAKGLQIVDRKNPRQRFWTDQWQVPKTVLAEDYAIVARFHDNVTGQPVIILAGILAEGTEAASEVVTNPEYLNAMLEKAPQNWDQKNLEAVIETHVVEGHPGPPTAVAVETW